VIKREQGVEFAWESDRPGEKIWKADHRVCIPLGVGIEYTQIRCTVSVDPYHVGGGRSA
jgi:hypothetical protein